MTVGVFDSLIYGRLFADDGVAAQFEDREQVRAMLRVEAALARAEAKAGLIPGDAAERIASVAGTLDLEPQRLADGTATAGVPVSALVSELQQAVGSGAAQYVHWGATSQDILDTALVLRLKRVLDLLDERLAGLIEQLVALAARHEASPMLARTRSQAAVPTSFGLKAAGWAAPLLRHRDRLAELRARVLVVQLGGAAGTRSVLGSAGSAVVNELARELALDAGALPWHAQRDAIVELAGWLSLVTGSLAKLGQDVLLLAQTEIGELRPGDGGGSSTMPQKENPVGAEMLVAIARHNAALVSEMHQALVHAHERDGAAWSSEWIALPQMAVAAGAALEHARRLVSALTVDTRRMAANLEAVNGLALAESAAYALADHLLRPEAARLVKEAARRTRAGGRHLLDELADATDAPVDWEALKRPAAQIETARAILQEFLARHARTARVRS